MKTLLIKPAMGGRRRAAGFTMVEIALSLGVIGIAMVALLGVLPTGLNVQRDNRDDTVIQQEGAYLLEAIRSGALNMNQLTNYVDYIRITNSLTPNKPISLTLFTNSEHIVGLLSRPKFQWLDKRLTSNTVTAKIRARAGSLSGRGTNTDFAFSYLLNSEIVPYAEYPYTLTNWTENGLSTDEKNIRSNRWRYALIMSNNLYEVRLTLRWPVRPDGTAGLNSQTFRTLVAGSLNSRVMLSPVGYLDFYNFLPSQYGY